MAPRTWLRSVFRQWAVFEGGGSSEFLVPRPIEGRDRNFFVFSIYSSIFPTYSFIFPTYSFIFFKYCFILSAYFFTFPTYFFIFPTHFLQAKYRNFFNSQGLYMGAKLGIFLTCFMSLLPVTLPPKSYFANPTLPPQILGTWKIFEKFPAESLLHDPMKKYVENIKEYVKN